MMQQAVLPFLRRKRMPSVLHLLQIKKSIEDFYDKNGFIQVFNNEVEWEGQPVDNWGFKMDL